MSANGDDKENAEYEIQEKQDDRPGDDKMKGKKKKDKKDKKTDPGRFQGAGMNFKAKLIGIESVPEARGDKMCQDAMQNLKAAVKAAGEHKHRIVINVSLEGLKILDDKSATIVHHHAVHKISFISRDATDSRAFGYVYGLGEGKHDFFGIKTEKPAEGLVLALRDLFQTVFEIKKREVELQKQKQKDEDEKKIGDKKKDDDSTSGDKNGSSYDDSSHKNGNLVELVDLESELSNLKQGIAQMNAFATSDDFFASGSDTPVSPQPGAASGPMFPVNFDSPASPVAPGPAGFAAAFPPAQNDPFIVPPSAVGQASVTQSNLFGQDAFAPQQKPAFPGFHSLPGSGPTSGNASPQPPRAQSSFSGIPVTQDPFKNDPFFSAGQQQPGPQVGQQQYNDKYAALAMLETKPDASLQQASSEWDSNAFGAFPSQTSQPASAWPGVSTTPLQPIPVVGRQSPSLTPPPAKASDPFAALDSVGGAKSHVDKQAFFKPQTASPTLKQMNKTTVPLETADPFGTTVPMGHPAMAGMHPPHSNMGMPNGPMGTAGMAPQYPQMYGAPMTPPPHMQQTPRPQGSPSIPPQQQPPVGNPFLTNQWPQ